eukprot:CFRG6461T1
METPAAEEYVEPTLTPVETTKVKTTSTPVQTTKVTATPTPAETIKVEEISTGAGKIRIAVEGCCHGELDKIYTTIAAIEKAKSFKIDLLLICGDFQAVRNQADLATMGCPPKYRSMMDFYKYYQGDKKAPLLTIFIGGNHEASNHLFELFHGGWVAPQIYYLGHAGVVNYRGVRIGGVSGIYKENHYRLGHFEKPPYNPGTMRSAYHTREYEIFKMSQIRTPINIVLSHDWPRDIHSHGDAKRLVQKKKFFEEEVRTKTLGSPPYETLLNTIRPQYWFCGHLHVKFAALVKHTSFESANQGSTVVGAGFASTRFLALDKCLPGRDFLQVVDVPMCEKSTPPAAVGNGEDTAKSTSAKTPTHRLQYDEEWLAILRLSHPYLSFRHQQPTLPPRFTDEVINKERQVIRTLASDLTIPENFEPIVPPYNPKNPDKSIQPSTLLHNPQTSIFLKKFGLDQIGSTMSEAVQKPAIVAAEPNPDKIDLEESDDDISVSEQSTTEMKGDTKTVSETRTVAEARTGPGTVTEVVAGAVTEPENGVETEITPSTKAQVVSRS